MDPVVQWGVVAAVTALVGLAASSFLKKPAKKSAPGVETGLLLPNLLDGKGQRSSTLAGKAIMAAAMRNVDDEAAEEAQKKWGRFGYMKQLGKNVQISMKSRENALTIARQGIKYVHESFEFKDGDKTIPFCEAMASPKNCFRTGTIHGTRRKPHSAGDFEFEVPYGDKILRGDELLVQVDKWVRQGVIELDCGEAISQVVRTKTWLDLSDRYFVLLGASSAMGPLLALLQLGANIVAVDICPKDFGKPEGDYEQAKTLKRPKGGPKDWWGPWAGPMPDGRRGLFAAVEDSCGSLYFPLPQDKDIKTRSQEAHRAGCNLLTQAPEIKNWLVDFLKSKNAKQVCVGAYAYMDGVMFVKLSVAMDGIIQGLINEWGNISLAYLCTPTDNHLVPAPAKAAIRSNRARAPLWQTLCSFFPKMNKPSKVVTVKQDDGVELHAVDAVVMDQGPNYILAKRMQHWRAIVAREDHGCIVSSNIAPSTATASVTSNKLFALAYDGMHLFKPMEVFKQETSNAVMAALLLNDLNNPTSAASPNTVLPNPLSLFSHTSFHGGAWRCGFKFTSIGAPSIMGALLGKAVQKYLTLYNTVQAFGWIAMLVSLFQAYTAVDGSSVWSHVGPLLTLFQNLAMMEVVHAIVGFVRSPWPSTLIQISSRVFIVALINWIHELHNNKAIYICCVAWGITEVVRYSWYALNTVGISSKPFTVLRYSTFLPLYPTGVYGEVSVMTAAMAFVDTADLATAPRFAEFWIFDLVLSPLGSLLGLSLSEVFKYIGYPAYLIGLVLLYNMLLGSRNKVLKRFKEEEAQAKAEKKDKEAKAK